MKFHAPAALLPGGWARDVRITVGDDGRIAEVTAGAADVRADASADTGARRLPGPVVAGMPNVHSHAFQRAIAGLTGTASASGDSFWSWRERMYDFVQRVDPDALEAIAAQLQVEMLKAGYTAVAEFQYLHHDPTGTPYANPAEMSERIAAAAKTSRIALTLLPVLYAHSGFGGQAPLPAQRRFVNGVDALLGIVDRLSALAHAGDFVLGVAPHSLRAVTADELRAVVSGVRGRDPMAPVHVHLAETRREVDDCIAWCGARPIEWLLRHIAVDPHWCLIHCTQASAEETPALAASGAVVGLCPTTEADLGDGIFPAEAFLRAGGSAGIGSDSHARLDPFEELRVLEYGQRLSAQRRNVLADAGSRVGQSLWQWLGNGGSRAMGRPCGRIAAGACADLVVLDADASALAGVPAGHLLDAAIFGPARSVVRDVYVGGRQVVVGGRHIDEDAVASRYARAMRRLGEAG